MLPAFAVRLIPLVAKIEREIVQTGRFVDISTLFFYNKVLIQCSKKLFGSQPVEVFYYTVIVDDSQFDWQGNIQP